MSKRFPFGATRKKVRTESEKKKRVLSVPGNISLFLHGAQSESSQRRFPILNHQPFSDFFRTRTVKIMQPPAVSHQKASTKRRSTLCSWDLTLIWQVPPFSRPKERPAKTNTSRPFLARSRLTPGPTSSKNRWITGAGTAWPCLEIRDRPFCRAWYVPKDPM